MLRLFGLFVAIVFVLTLGLCLAQEPAEPGSVDEVEYSMDPATDFQVRTVPDVWTTVPVTIIGMVPAVGSERNHIHFQWAGRPHFWYLGISENSDQCLKIRLDDVHVTGTFIYRVQARLRVVEPDGSLGPPSDYGPVTWWVARIPALARPFSRRD